MRANGRKDGRDVVVTTHARLTPIPWCTNVGGEQAGFQRKRLRPRGGMTGSRVFISWTIGDEGHASLDDYNSNLLATGDTLLPVAESEPEEDVCVECFQNLVCCVEKQRDIRIVSTSATLLLAPGLATIGGAGAAKEGAKAVGFVGSERCGRACSLRAWVPSLVRTRASSRDRSAEPSWLLRQSNASPSAYQTFLCPRFPC